jgi:lipoprotein LprG
MIRTRRNPLARLVFVVMALCAAVGLLAGCSSGKGSTPTKARGPLPTAQELLGKVVTSTKALHDVQLDLQVDGEVPQLPVKSVDAYLTNQPQVGGQGDADVTFNGTDVQAKFVVTAGDLWVKIGTGEKYANQGPAAKIYDASAILDPNRGLAHLLETMQSPKVVDREQIIGIDTVKMSGVVPAESLTGLVPGYKSGPRPVTFWVQEDAPNNLVRADVAFDKGTLQVNLSSWGKKVTLIDPKTGS